jgi:homoserine O-acetyltransferase/O-succinyltransferase
MPSFADNAERFEIGDLPLQSGETLPDATLVYKTWGTLNAARSNAVLLPTAYGGTHADNAWLTEPGRALDSRNWFVISPNLFGAGLSSSPSNTIGAQGGANFPQMTVYDNVAAQHRLVTERFGITELALVAGFSMGAQQSFHWAAAHPEMVKRIAPYCGSARTAHHNYVFLEGIRAALTTDPTFNGGHYDQQPKNGKRAVGKVWAGWGLSQTFYREERWVEMGFASREAVLDGYADMFESLDANDLLAMLATWQRADIGVHPRYEGDFLRALTAITAKAVVMPSRTDLYFPPEDSELEVSHMPDATLAVIPSVWGHAAGGNSNAVDSAFINDQIARLLEES